MGDRASTFGAGLSANQQNLALMGSGFGGMATARQQGLAEDQFQFEKDTFWGKAWLGAAAGLGGAAITAFGA